MIIKKNRIFITLILCFLVMLSTIFCNFNVVKAQVQDSSGVIEDLSKDTKFDISNYPEVKDDYSMNVIHLAEGESGSLYLYVYQPSGEKGFVLARAISLCTKDFEHYSITSSLDTDNTPFFIKYNLELVDYSGTLFKYKVKDYKYTGDNNFKTNGEFDNTLTRNYEIATIWRPFIDGVDVAVDSEAIETIKGLEVGRCFSIKTLSDGSSSVSNEVVDVITVTEKFVGSMRLKGGFLTFDSDKDAYFVSFKTNKQIDSLLEADVYYRYSSYSRVDGLSKKLEDSGEETVNLNFEDERIWNGSGWFDPVYNWNTIYSMSEFNSFLSTNSKYIDKRDVPNGMSKHDWVLFFADFSYFKSYGSGYGESYMPGSELWTEVKDVAILRLKFETDGVVYNLGVVDDMSTPDREPDIIFDKNPDLSWIFMLIFLIILLILLAPILPYIFSFIFFLLSLPFKFIGFLSKKIKKDGGSNGKKT